MNALMEVVKSQIFFPRKKKYTITKHNLTKALKERETRNKQ